MSSDTGVVLLEAKAVSKSFGGVKALQSVDFEINSHEVHALVGENGAGKSTLVRVLTGLYAPDAGSIYADGKELRLATPQRANEAGIAAIHQDLSLVPRMTVHQNLSLGIEPLHPRFIGRIDRRKSRERSHHALERIGLEVPLDAQVGSLSTANQQLLEVARAVDRAARVIFMDEPTARLSGTEAERLFTIIRQLKSQGIGVVYISHRFAEIWTVSDRVTVLRDGRRVATSRLDEVTPDQVIESMAGRRVESRYPDRNVGLGEAVLRVEGVSRGEDFQNISFELRKGEILGIAGLVGSGRSSLVNTLFGYGDVDEGSIEVLGESLGDMSPSDSIERGIGLVPESQLSEAAFMSLDLQTNITLPIVDRISRWGLLDRRAQQRIATEQMERLDVRAQGPRDVMGRLSGGNRQKVVIARWLAASSRIFLMDEATAGVDVKTKFELYRLLQALTADGGAVVWVSSDMPEVLGVCDRILVMRHGEIVDEFTSNEATEEKLLDAMFGTNDREVGS